MGGYFDVGPYMKKKEFSAPPIFLPARNGKTSIGGMSFGGGGGERRGPRKFGLKGGKEKPQSQTEPERQQV